MIFTYISDREEFKEDIELAVRQLELMTNEERAAFGCAFCRLSPYHSIFIDRDATSSEEGFIKAWFVGLIREYPNMELDDILRTLRDIQRQVVQHEELIALMDDEGDDDDDDDDDCDCEYRTVRMRSDIGRLTTEKEALINTLRTIAMLDDIDKIKQEVANALGQYEHE
jgi:hypothetical protein